MPVRFDHKNICILSETHVRDRVGETRSVKQTHMTGLCEMHVRNLVSTYGQLAYATYA